MDRPELYDLRFGSGVVREDDGVSILLGTIEGEDLDESSDGNEASGEFIGGVKGNGGAFGIIDIRFNRRASVGLIVRAPRPVACALPGITDNRLLDEGVWFLCVLGLAGDRAVLIGDATCCSGVPTGV